MKIFLSKISRAAFASTKQSFRSSLTDCFPRLKFIRSETRTRIVGRLCQTPALRAFHRMGPRGCERHGRAARPGERAGANESNALQFWRSLNQYFAAC